MFKDFLGQVFEKITELLFQMNSEGRCDQLLRKVTKSDVMPVTSSQREAVWMQ